MASPAWLPPTTTVSTCSLMSQLPYAAAGEPTAIGDRRLWGVLPGDEAVLHGKQRGPGPGGDTHLAVGVLDVMVGGLGRDPEHAGDLLGLEAPGQQADHFDLALGQPRRALIGGRRWPAASSTTATASGASRPASASSMRVSAAFSGERAGRCGPRFGHGVIGVAAASTRDAASREAAPPAVVPRPVETLVVAQAMGASPERKGGTQQDPLGVVGVQPHPLPVVGCQRFGLLPDPHGHGHPSQIVHQGARESPRSTGHRVRTPRRRPGQLGDPAASARPESERRGRQSGPWRPAPNRSRHPRASTRARARPPGSAPRGKHSDPGRGSGCFIGDQRRRCRIERPACPPADHVGDGPGVTQGVVEGGVAGDMDDPRRRGIASPATPSGKPLAIPTFRLVATSAETSGWSRDRR